MKDGSCPKVEAKLRFEKFKKPCFGKRLGSAQSTPSKSAGSGLFEACPAQRTIQLPAKGRAKVSRKADIIFGKRFYVS
jgi:hypothetical protein